MKRFFSAFVCVCLLALLLPAASAQTADFVFTRENFPVLDGSTSMAPLGRGIASVLLGESREEVSDLISFNRTTQSFRNLRDGSCDVVIAAEPQNIVFDEMREADFSWEIEMIAREALVFVVNETNPVDSLTVEQLRDIYAGTITNWAEVGGEDLPIEAFQRNATSGSQVMMEKLVMCDTPMADAPATHIPTEMGALIDAVKSYDNSANAIGYTVFYYAEEMEMAQGLKILRVEGVEPSADTLRSEEYPLLNGYYCCIAADAEELSPARVLYNWLLSEDGQALLTSEGYVSVYEAGEAQECSVPVRIDDSSYLPASAEAPLYTVAEGRTDMLTAAEGRGEIYPYYGSRSYAVYDSTAGWRDDYLAGGACGFYTHDGMLVTEPVYGEISACLFGREETTGYCWIFSRDGENWGFASSDGSIVSEECYSSIASIGEALLCVRSYEESVFDVYSTALELLYTQDDFKIGGMNLMPDSFADGVFVCWDQDTCFYCAVKDSNVLLGPADYISSCGDGMITVMEGDAYSLYRVTGEQVPVGDETDAKAESIYRLTGKLYRVNWSDGTQVICDRDGNLFEWDYDDCIWETYDLIKVVKNDTAVWYDGDGRVRFRNLPRNWEYAGSGIFTETTDSGMTLHLADGSAELFVPDAFYCTVFSDHAAVYGMTGDYSWQVTLVNADLEVCWEQLRDVTGIYDPLTDAVAVLVTDAAGVSTVMSADLSTLLYRGSAQAELQGGLLTLWDESGFTCLNRQGDPVFYYPYYGLLSGD